MGYRGRERGAALQVSSFGHSISDRVMAYQVILHHFDESPFSEKSG